MSPPLQGIGAPGKGRRRRMLTQETGTDRLDLTDLLPISDLLLRGGMFRFRAAGWSMYPTLCKGDWLSVEPLFAGEPQPGDLLLFHHELPHGVRLICHRLVAVEEAAGGRRLVMKGDAVAGSGEVINPEQILGRVIAVTRGWPWSLSGRYGPALARRIDRGKERVGGQLAGWLESIQACSLYRNLTRRLLGQCIVFYQGIPEGTSRLGYQPISRCTGLPAAAPDRRGFHLLAKLAGTCAGSLLAARTAEGYRIQHLHVRIRYRRLGVASELVMLAATLASASGATSLRATIEQDNRPARRLFDKMGFREASPGSAHSMILVREMQGAASDGQREWVRADG